MNLQAIARLLQSPTPRIAAALDAVADCLDAEQDVVVLLANTARGVAPPLGATSDVALNPVAFDVEAMLRHTTPSLARRIRLHLAEPSPTVDGDGNRLRSGLLGLVQHVLEWGAREGTRRRVVVTTREANGHAELSVGGVPLSLVFGRHLDTTLAVTHKVVAAAHGAVARIDRRPSDARVRIVFPNGTVGHPPGEA
jgi:hypothetical protein